MSLLAFAGGNEAVAGRASLLAASLLSAGAPLVQIINAAGLIAGQNPLSPTSVAPLLVIDPFYIDPDFAVRQRPGDPQLIMPLGELRRFPFFGALSGRLGGDAAEWLPQVLAWLLPPLTPHAAPGADIYHTTTGTLGFPVVWPGGDGFLTAGHVCRSATGPVYENAPPNNPTVGNVTYAADPDGKGATPFEDVAVINGRSGPQSPSPFGKNPANLAACDTVHILTPHGVLQDRVRAFVQFYYAATPAMTGTWGECYMTTAGVTVPGDSGAAVVSAANAPVGTVVAGNLGVTDLIQKVDYQLQRTGIAGLSLA